MYDPFEKWLMVAGFDKAKLYPKYRERWHFDNSHKRYKSKLLSELVEREWQAIESFYMDYCHYCKYQEAVAVYLLRQQAIRTEWRLANGHGQSAGLARS